MTEAEWLASADPTPMLGFLRGKASDRKVRLFSLACVNRFQPELADPCMERTRKAIAVLEGYIDGRVSDNEYQTAAREALEEIANNVLNHRLANWSGSDMAHALLANGPHAAATKHVHFSMDFAFDTVVEDFGEDESDDQAWERATRPVAILLCQWLRDVFGPILFRRIILDPAWLTRNSGTVVKLAQAIYEERAFDRLPILADALEEAGCHEPDILAHCRQPGPHVRGCHVIDLLLCKQ
jgi:hypothetical protein